eukprot:5267364-Pleurochrysis_carterae.AAC.1
MCTSHLRCDDCTVNSLLEELVAIREGIEIVGHCRAHKTRSRSRTHASTCRRACAHAHAHAQRKQKHMHVCTVTRARAQPHSSVRANECARRCRGEYKRALAH